MKPETDSKLFPMLFFAMMMAVPKLPTKPRLPGFKFPRKIEFGRHLTNFKTTFKASAVGLGKSANASMASVKMWTIAKVGALGGSLALIWTAFTQPNFITESVNDIILPVVGLPPAEPGTINIVLIAIVCIVAVGIILFVSRRK